MMQLNPIPSAPLPALPSKSRTLLKAESQPGVPVEEGEGVPTEPPILNDLFPLDRLIITKRLHLKNTLFLRGTRNRFYVRTPDQILVYTVEEKTKWWVGYLCYGLRPLQLHVANSEGTEIMRIVRPFACTSRIFPCQMQNLMVYSPPGNCIGRIQQQWSALKPLYLVLNEAGDPLFWVRGPRMTICFFCDVQFAIQRTTDGTHVGSTSKRWQGLTHAMFLSPVTDRFNLTFEKSLDVVEKALLLAVSILMDYMYYDS